MTDRFSAAAGRLYFTREKLQRHFLYEPETGVLRWRDTGVEITGTSNRGYIWVRVEGYVLLAHRAIWRMQTGEWPQRMVDHIDGCRTNNRWKNLRQADHSLNGQNVFKAMSTNRTGVRGVSKDKRRQARPYRAEIEVNGRKHHIGCFATMEEAGSAYMDAKRKFHAEVFAGVDA